jgi:hypothetical protein
MSVSERESTSSGWLQLSSHICVLERNPIADRTLSGVWTCCLLVFVLAALCWTKSLLCNVAAFTGMLLYSESTLQLCSSRRFYEGFKDLFRFPVSRPNDMVFRPDAHQSTTSVRTPISV